VCAVPLPCLPLVQTVVVLRERIDVVHQELFKPYMQHLFPVFVNLLKVQGRLTQQR
jgi:hypothetical protein